MSRCHCSIIPSSVLEALSKREDLSDTVRAGLADAARVDHRMRGLRDSARKLTIEMHGLASFSAVAAGPPRLTVSDCAQTTSLPGSPVGNPGHSADPSVRGAFEQTQKVADFYRQIFGRNSIDGAGMSLLSSVHFGVDFNNAFWNGSQMVYGDGDGQIFIDFTQGSDVVCHELTHGVTQHSLGLAYVNQAGGLNESLSDVFGSVFRQWSAGQDAAGADWLIGADIMGPFARAKGFTCLRDLANPGAAHCLSKQPAHFAQYRDGMDPHESSGIPNHAFYLAAAAIGGNTWDKVALVWYDAMTGLGLKPNLEMQAFANATRAAARSRFGAEPATIAAIDQAWLNVGL